MSGINEQTSQREELLARRMKVRRPIRSGTLVGVGVFVLILGVLAGGILGHVVAPPVVTTSGSEHLYLTVSFDPYTGADKYFPGNFSVPANVPVTITITNYDNGTNAVPASLAQVLGTVGGTETVTNATVSGANVSSIPVDQVAHTFTLISAPYDINVPVPAAQGHTPSSVTFTVDFGTAGQFTWHCMAPCDGHAMTTPGYMTGTVTVVGQ